MEAETVQGNPEMEKQAMETFFGNIHAFRKAVDGLIQEAESYLPPKAPAGFIAAREMSLVRTKLQEAKMWLGKVLEVGGSPFPKELADKAE